MPEDPVSVAGKTSRYGDLPTTFEELYKAFFLAPDNMAPRAYAGVLGLAFPVAKKNGDHSLQQLYDALKKDGHVNTDEMLLLVWKAFEVMYDDGTWTRAQQPFAFMQPRP